MTNGTGYPAKLLSGLWDKERCGWCKNERHPVYRRGLCRHCYEKSRQLASAEAAASRPPANRFERQEIESVLKMAQKMVELAKAEGKRYGEIDKKQISGLTLEHELSFVSKRFVKTDLFHGDVTALDRSLTPDQKRYLFYLLARMSCVYLRRHRRAMAFVAVIREENKKIDS